MSSCGIIQFGPSKQIHNIQFTDTGQNDAYHFIYQNTENSPELITLKSLYLLDSIAQQGNSELEQILYLMNWTNSRWKHNGSNKPSSSNTLTILKEAEEGKQFRCVEYGIVLRSILASIGLEARTLGLKTKAVEVTSSGAGHVLTEVWSNQFNKWVVLDAQVNLIPTLNDIPLNAVEFQKAMVQGQNFKLVDINGEVSAKRRKSYLRFIAKYLYYFDFKFDQREVAYDSLFKVNDKTVLMLVPDDAKKPTVFQKKFDMTYLEYTNSLNDFYRTP